MDDEETNKVKRMFGIDRTLHTPGDNADKTQERKTAVEIIERMNDQRKNARQTMLSHKGAQGNGVNPDFPTRLEIETNMEGHQDDYMVEVFGDGSNTSPHPPSGGQPWVGKGYGSKTETSMGKIDQTGRNGTYQSQPQDRPATRLGRSLRHGS